MPNFNSRQIIIFSAIVAVLLGSEGCVRRRLTIRSDPPGAAAYLDNEELGKTPISRNFDFYGKRELRLVKEGYETHTEMISLPTPWYEWPGIDFFSEVLTPGEITDRRHFHVRMKPQNVVAPDSLIADAERMKALAHSGGTYRVDSSVPTYPVPTVSPTPDPAQPFPVPPIPQYPEPEPTPLQGPPVPNPTLQTLPPVPPAPYQQSPGANAVPYR